MTDLELTKLRATYLQEAAHLLAPSSPAAAAFLGRARHELIASADADKPSREYDALCREACSACGNILIPGWSCRVSTRFQSQPDLAGRTQGVKSLKNHTSCVVYECLRCHRETIQALQSKPRRQMRKLAMAVESKPAELSKPAQETNDKISKTNNASSKQRQKARKGGLQALLEKNKAQSSNAGGLDLMDFAM